MASSSSPQLTPPPKKPPPIPWSPIETQSLIEAYQEKWYSLKRGQLKASQWEEVSTSVAERCGYDDNHLSKTAVQCRHKMEKLRKRYRSERQLLSSSWPYFHLMDLMERGPFPINARPINSFAPVRIVSHSTEEDEDEMNKSRSINHILRRPQNKAPSFDNFPPPSRGLRTSMVRKKMESYEEEEGGGGEVFTQLASVVRAFGEGYVKVENMRMEMMKETERYRREMEKKRTEMILQSQKNIVEAIAKAFGSRKRYKKTEEM
ncbi:hypothetical protein GIB67_043039 [Kingdonia uniflora]|uniref:Myb/SANT-like DNA-binding domain-containing protein n=1 Tax=Kingdonia uniflora TaxID=39325 RepID=A0A7J7NT65_9MAGN|nr:hypothetical protein GIB67_043039 [Kingdonia uniflora]